MRARISAAIMSGTVLTAGFFGARAAEAQNASLAEQLKTQYKLAKVGMDANGWSVVNPGTVLVIQKGGILGVPPANGAMTTSTYKDGELHPPNGFMTAMVSKVSRLLTVNEKVYVIKIDVHQKEDKIALMIIECDACNGVQQPATYKSAVVFQFPKGYLEGADVSQVQDVISQVLAPDGSSTDQVPAQPQQQEQQQQPAASEPPAAPVTVQVGQTTDQVKAALGAPEKIFDVGKKLIWVYKDLKITFIDGKVSDVQ